MRILLCPFTSYPKIHWSIVIEGYKYYDLLPVAMETSLSVNLCICLYFWGLANKQIHATCFLYKLRPRATTSKEHGASYATDTHHPQHQVPRGSISPGHPRPACLKGPWTEVSRFKCLRHDNVHKSESKQGTGAAAEGRTKGKRGKCKYITARINVVTARMGSHPSDLRYGKCQKP